MGKRLRQFVARLDVGTRALGVWSRGAARALWRVKAELLLGLAIMAGWALVTLGISRVARADVVWPLSGGLFSLSLAGWRLLWQIAAQGFYALTRPEDGSHGA